MKIKTIPHTLIRSSELAAAAVILGQTKEGGNEHRVTPSISTSCSYARMTRRHYLALLEFWEDKGGPHLLDHGAQEIR